MSGCGSIRYVYREVSDLSGYLAALREVDFDVVLYNYHAATMPWLTPHTIQRRRPNIGIPHECDDGMFDKVISINPNIAETDRVFAIPRPIVEELPPATDRCEDPAFHEFVSYRNPSLARSALASATGLQAS